MSLPELDFSPPLAPLTDEALNHALDQIETFAAGLEIDAPENDERMKTMLDGYGLDPLALGRALERLLPIIGHHAPLSATNLNEVILFTGGYQYGLLLARLATEYAETSK